MTGAGSIFFDLHLFLAWSEQPLQLSFTLMNFQCLIFFIYSFYGIIGTEFLLTFVTSRMPQDTPVCIILFSRMGNIENTMITTTEHTINAEYVEKQNSHIVTAKL